MEKRLSFYLKTISDCSKALISCRANFMKKLINIIFSNTMAHFNEKKKTKLLNQFLKLNGCKLNFIEESVKSLFISKYYLNVVTELPLLIISFFFDGKKILIKSIELIRSQLIDLILSLKALRGLRFISTSISIIYDGANPLKKL